MDLPIPAAAVPVPTTDVSAVAQAITALEDAIKQRDAEMNTPVEQVAAENARIQAIYDKMTQAVVKQDINEVRDNIAASPNTGPLPLG